MTHSDHDRRTANPRWQVVDGYGTPHGAPRSAAEALRLARTLRILEPAETFHLVAA